MERKVYSYREALEIVEEFMIESGIRKYCTTVCKGYCCGLCSFSENACFRNEGRRLPCSIYLCTALLDLFPNRELLEDLRDEIAGRLTVIMGDNPFFNPNTEDVQTKFRIPKRNIDKLKSLNLESYKKITKYLIENQIAVQELSAKQVGQIKRKFLKEEREENGE